MENRHILSMMIGMNRRDIQDPDWDEQKLRALALGNRPGWDAGDARVNHGVAVASIVAMWVIYFLVTTGLSVLMGADELMRYILPRILVVVAGIACTFILYLFLQKVQPKTFRARLTVALGMVIPLVVLYSIINMLFFYYWFPSPDTPYAIAKLQEKFAIPWQTVVVIDSSVRWYFFFAVWATLYVAFGYANEMNAVERRANLYRLEAKNAQLRALHYQIKPHFLFNTLNSLSTLVLRGARDDAETMIMNLSSFLRSCLEIESENLVTLAEETALQKLYLDIEQVRFPNRLEVNFAIPPETRSELVPSLILQPLIENAIKYGVSPSRTPIAVHIRARVDDQHLYLTVENDIAPDTPVIEGGTGLGLRNVRDRLITRFGSQAGCEWGPRPDGGFTVAMWMPRGNEGYEAATAHLNR
jgi:two-component system LytT family sensor kinase